MFRHLQAVVPSIGEALGPSVFSNDENVGKLSKERDELFGILMRNKIARRLEVIGTQRMVGRSKPFKHLHLAIDVFAFASEIRIEVRRMRVVPQCGQLVLVGEIVASSMFSRSDSHRAVSEQVERHGRA